MEEAAAAKEPAAADAAEEPAPEEAVPAEEVRHFALLLSACEKTDIVNQSISLLEFSLAAHSPQQVT